MKLKLIESLILIGVLLGLIGCSAMPEPELDLVKVKLNWEPGVHFLGFYMAEEQGFYFDEQLNVEMEHLFDVEELFELPERVASGEFDISLGSSLLVNGQARGVEVTAITSIIQLSPNAFFARANSGIVTINDFAGKTIAVKSENMRINLKYLLEMHGLSLEDVTTFEAGFDMAPFYSGEVDVWVGFLNNEVIQVRLNGIDVVTFPLYEYGLEDASTSIFTSAALLESDSDFLVRYTRATLKGWNWALNNPADAVDLMLNRFPELAADRAFLLASFESYLPLIRVPGVPIGYIDCESWESYFALEFVENKETLCTTEIFDAIAN